MNLNTAYYIDTSKLIDEKRILQRKTTYKYNTPPLNMTSLTTNSPSSPSPQSQYRLLATDVKNIYKKVIIVEKHKKHVIID